MTFMGRTLNWILTIQKTRILRASTDVHRWNSLSVIVRKVSYMKQRDSGSVNRTRGGFEELPGWMVKMHQALMAEVRLPSPAPVSDHAMLKPGSLECCSVDNLMSLAMAVTCIDVHTNALLVELWRRMDSMDAEEIISVADIFFTNQVFSSWYSGAMAVHLMERMDVMQLTASQLARLTFHCLGRNRTTQASFHLALEDSILRSIDSLSLNQLAVMCHSFFTSQNRIRSMDLLDAISTKLLHQLDSMNNWYLPIFMKTLRFSNFIKISFYKDLGHLLVEKNYLEKFRTLAQIMHIAHAYASVRISHPELFTHILQSCCSPRYRFRMKDLSKIIWACGTLVTDSPKDIDAIRRILEYVQHNITVEEAVNYPENLVDLVSGLCILNIRCDDILHIMFHPRHVKAVFGLGQGHVKLPQLDLISQWLHLEHPDYTGHRLDQVQMEQLEAARGSFPARRDTGLHKGFDQAVDVLTALLGDNRVWSGQLLPHFGSSDIVLVWDGLESEFADHREVDWSTGQGSGRYTRLVVQLLSMMQTSYDGKALGVLHMKLRQLTQLGYTPVMIDASDALTFVYRDRHSTQRFLLDKLSEALVIDLAHLSSTCTHPR